MDFEKWKRINKEIDEFIEDFQKEIQREEKEPEDIKDLILSNGMTEGDLNEYVKIRYGKDATWDGLTIENKMKVYSDYTEGIMSDVLYKAYMMMQEG